MYHRLRDLEERGDTIQVGLIAAGTFGSQIAAQMAHAAGMRLAAIAGLDTEKSLRAGGRGVRRPEQVTAQDQQPGVGWVPKAGSEGVHGVDGTSLRDGNVGAPRGQRLGPRRHPQGPVHQQAVPRPSLAPGCSMMRNETSR